ncbi:hypothetical protein M378DRAFT_455010 [Amanita muscaria Koide BX008]|uniref:Uncharacterized protein n=1 Tax=Amanita muscaria (strain Koide BX008) TaxID=946122 RepID=A0A0C2WJ47_AMAMK|nr:hypothetical protein M378DRAFT_455010 [Amanita muscaria Koide BX008]
MMFSPASSARNLINGNDNTALGSLMLRFPTFISIVPTVPGNNHNQRWEELV